MKHGRFPLSTLMDKQIDTNGFCYRIDRLLDLGDRGWMWIVISDRQFCRAQAKLPITPITPTLYQSALIKLEGKKEQNDNFSK